jgi:hypothetical protein
MQARKKRPARSSFDIQDFSTALSCVQSDIKKVLHHDHVALTVLFLTGMRLSNLQYITYGMLRTFFMQKKSFTVSLVKTGRSVGTMTYHYNSAYKSYIK